MMRITSLAAILTFVSMTPAQGDIVYYKFDSQDASQIVNYASGTAAAPRLASSTWMPSAIYAPGRFGGALKASPYIGTAGYFLHSGWTAGHQGSMTIAFFLKNRSANTPLFYSPVAGQPSWSLASGGSAGSGLQLRGWGGADLNADFGLPLCLMMGWNHFAIAIDAGAGTATWYLNGAPAVTSRIATGVGLAAQSELLVGTDYVTACGSVYDIDEFRMLGRAASAAEISAWAAATTAAAVTFGNTSITSLDAVGDPVLGNGGFAVRVQHAGSGLLALAAGTSYSRFSGHSLPIDLSQLLSVPAGTNLWVAIEVVAPGELVQGEAQIPLPVPADPALAGFGLYLQGFVLDGAGGLTASNALAVSVGL